MRVQKSIEKLGRNRKLSIGADQSTMSIAPYVDHSMSLFLVKEMGRLPAMGLIPDRKG
jgi:hypothetical protein